MSVQINCFAVPEIVRGDDSVIPVQIKQKDSSDNYVVIDYSAYNWSAGFRYQENSTQYFPATVVVDTELNRLEITFSKDVTKNIAGSGVLDLQSVKIDDNTVRTWFKTPTNFVEDVTYAV